MQDAARFGANNGANLGSWIKRLPVKQAITLNMLLSASACRSTAGIQLQQVNTQTERFKLPSSGATGTPGMGPQEDGSRSADAPLKPI